MKKAAAIVIAVMAVLLVIAAKKPLSDADQIKRLGEQAIVALEKNDTKALDRIWADDYVRIYPDGTVKTKADRIREMKVGNVATAVTSAQNDENLVKVYGDAAVQRVVSRVTRGGAVTRMRVTVFWIKRHGRWQAVASHSSNLS